MRQFEQGRGLRNAGGASASPSQTEPPAVACRVPLRLAPCHQSQPAGRPRAWPVGRRSSFSTRLEGSRGCSQQADMQVGEMRHAAGHAAQLEHNQSGGQVENRAVWGCSVRCSGLCMQVVGGQLCRGHASRMATRAGHQQAARPGLTLSIGRVAAEPAGLDSSSVICGWEAPGRELWASLRQRTSWWAPADKAASQQLMPVEPNSCRPGCQTSGSKQQRIHGRTPAGMLSLNSPPTAVAQSGRPLHPMHRCPSLGMPAGQGALTELER